jgi:hypothetical protein
VVMVVLVLVGIVVLLVEKQQVAEVLLNQH